MPQHTTPEMENAIEHARALAPAVVYLDPEIGGFGVYTHAQLTTEGAWVCGEWIVFDTEKEAP